MDIKDYTKDTDHYSEENGMEYHNLFAPRGWNTMWWPQAKEMIFNCDDASRNDLILSIANNVGRALSSYDRALRHDTQSQCCTLLSHIAEHFSLDINHRIMEKVVEDGALEGFNNDNDVPKFLKDAYESLKKSAAEIEPQADELVKFFGADEFPIHVLPSNLQRIINEIAINKCATKEMIFMHLLALASSCVGSGRTLCPHREFHGTWHEPAIFWGMIIADSGEAKSPTMKVVFKELRRAQIHEEKLPVASLCLCAFVAYFQDNPEIFPSLSISIPSATGVGGNPGIRIISPRIGITKPAPAAYSNSLTVTIKFLGRPIFVSLSENDFCVLAIQTGKLSKPSFLISSSPTLALGEYSTSSAP